MKNLRNYAAALALVVVGLMGYEGFSPTPYQDQAKVWTNGYGNTEGVTKNTPPVSKPEAKAKLEQHVDKFAKRLDRELTVPAGPNQTAAYLSLMYNIGPDAFAGSSVKRLHNQSRFREACDAILRWNKITINGVLTFSRGLMNRREKERDTCYLDLQQ